MADPIDQLRTSLQAQSLSVTGPRIRVFRALQNKEPQTMHEIVAACQNDVDRASVYRTITLFEQIGIVQRLQMGWKYKLELSDAFHQHHHHLSCRQCGQVIPLAEDDQLEARLAVIAQQQGFEMQGHQLEIQGLCQTCLKT